MTLPDRIEINPEIMGGKPVVRGTRIPVERVLIELGHGADMGELLSMYPSLTEDDVRACHVFAAGVIAHREIIGA